MKIQNINYKNKTNIYFADFFAGIGGFHHAFNNSLSKNRATAIKANCKLVCEIDKYAKELYSKQFNYEINNIKDISEVNTDLDMSNIDIVFCGFPCQSFSSAGARRGFSDQKTGNLIFKVIEIIEKTLPKIILLENVSHLVSHDNGKTFDIIMSHFKHFGYITTENPLILSPSQFKIPQNRKRVFIPMVHKTICNDTYLRIEESVIEKNNLVKPKILDNFELNKKYCISAGFQLILNAWKEFVEHFNSRRIKIPVIWLDEMINNNYKSKSKAKSRDWYKKYIYSMRTFYIENKLYIDQWVIKHDPFTWNLRRNRKLEWQAGFDTKFENTYLQERQSGLRFRKTDCFPTLVATVQTPLVNQNGYWRKLSPKEVSRLQSFPQNHFICENEFQAYKQYGNSINVKVAEYVIDKYLMQYIRKLTNE